MDDDAISTPIRHHAASRAHAAGELLGAAAGPLLRRVPVIGGLGRSGHDGRPGDGVLLELDLSRGLLDAPPATPVEALRSRHRPWLGKLVEKLEDGARDRHVRGLVAHLGPWQPSLAQSAELRSAVARLREAGKDTVCWSEAYGEMGPGNALVHLASAFGEVWLQPTGDLGLTGMTAHATFLRGALDKLGVEPQISQRHEYKTAGDQLTATGLTEAHREMLEALVGSATETVVADVARGRGLEVDAVRAAMERAPLTASEALEAGLVDRLGYRGDVLDAVRERLGEPSLVYVHRHTDRRRALAQASVPGRSRPVVAVVHAVGPIHLGRSGASPFGGRSVGSESLAGALRAAARDDDVRAVVLRVESPGGSYVASDALRHEVQRLRASGTTVVASMGGVAASGGYYIAMPCEQVLASAGTLTGSIGVLAGKQVLTQGLERLGVRRESVVAESAGRYADMFSSDRGFTDDEWARLDAWLDRVYDDFTAKAAADRGLDVEHLRTLARGRVWTGADARARGLVDDIGGLSDAVDVACRLAGITRERASVRGWPAPSLLERLSPPTSSEAPAAHLAGWSAGGGTSVSGPAPTTGDHPLLDRLLALSGVAVPGVLTMPFQVTLR